MVPAANSSRPKGNRENCRYRDESASVSFSLGAETGLDKEDYATIKAVVESYAYLADLVGDKNTTIRRLRKMLFGARTEKTSAVVGGKKDKTASQRRKSVSQRGFEPLTFGSGGRSSILWLGDGRSDGAARS